MLQYQNFQPKWGQCSLKTQEVTSWKIVCQCPTGLQGLNCKQVCINWNLVRYEKVNTSVVPMIKSRYSLNIAKVGIKHQLMNQSIVPMINYYDRKSVDYVMVKNIFLLTPCLFICSSVRVWFTFNNLNSPPPFFFVLPPCPFICSAVLSLVYIQ